MQGDPNFKTEGFLQEEDAIRPDTVGAVAIDKKGNIASGTSTGGTPNKYPGRVGDSPLIGAGHYADNSIGGVSTSGWGEAMIKVVMAKTVVDLMEANGLDPEKAAQDGLKVLVRKVDGYGGIIALSKARRRRHRIQHPAHGASIYAHRHYRTRRAGLTGPRTIP